MPLDGPKVGLIVLVFGLVVVGLAIYLFERRHFGRSRKHGREPQRLPLFGTEQLSIRSLQGDDDDEADAPPAPAAPRSAPPVQRPSPAFGNGRAEQSATNVQRMAPEPLRAEVRPPSRPAPPARPAPAPMTAPVAAPPQRDPYRPAPSVAPAMSAAPTAEHPVAAGAATSAATSPMSRAPAIADLAMIEGETLRFSIPTDGTVEFVPGRLEIVAGPEAGREIRFARAPGETDVEVTFGRSEGPPNRHVQIVARTVSRRHAVMSLIDEHWQLTNLSSTNPVVLNGRVLAGNEVAPLLVEGDRIEMGEVAFVFHDG